MVELARGSGWRLGRRRIKAKRLRIIERCKAEGMSNREIARCLGVTENAIRKLVGPEDPPIQEVIPLTLSAAPSPEEEKEPPPMQTEPAAQKMASHEEPTLMSLDVDPLDRSFDRLLACFGLIDDAVPLFADSADVPCAGVLLAVPLLVHSGIFGLARKLYGSIGPAFYGLRTTLLVLMLMALLRVKRPEWLKKREPESMGRLLGLDRVPEMKTLRRKLARLAACHRAEQLGAELARRRVEQRGQTMGFLYVDGHVRVYHGKRSLPKAHVARMRLSLPATTDYWINDQAGDPLFVITAKANAGLVKMLPRVTREIRDLVGDRRVTMVFDRGGWSPKLFKKLIEDGFDVLTYRKGKCRRVSEQRFVKRRARLDGRWVSYQLHDQPVRFLKGTLRLRQVTRLSDDGHQTQVVTSRWDLRDIEVAYRMFERWRQENFFKYMREEYLLDALIDYQVEPDDPTRTVPNPERKELDKQIRMARTDVTKLEQAYGAAAHDNPEEQRPTMRGFKIAHGKIGKQLRVARERLADLVAKRRSLSVRVQIRDVSEDAVIKLATERKHLSDILKMVAYQAESDLLSLLHPHYARANEEGRTLLHEIFASQGGLEVVGDELRVTLSPLSSPHRTLAANALCEHLNQTQTTFPGTSLWLHFVVQPPRVRGMAFPGPRPLPPSDRTD